MMKVYILAYLYSGDDVLLLRRKNVEFGSGLYSLPGGLIEQGETASQGIAREVREELGLDIPEKSFELVHTLNRKGTETEFMALVFRANVTGMQPKNNEPDKHDDLKFFAVDHLPENIIPAHKQAIECIKRDINYSEHGW